MCTVKIQSSNNKGRKINETEALKVSDASKKQTKEFWTLFWRSYVGGHDGVAKVWWFGSLSQQLGCCTYNLVSLRTLQNLWVHFGTWICPHVQPERSSTCGWAPLVHWRAWLICSFGWRRWGFWMWSNGDGGDAGLCSGRGQFQKHEHVCTRVHAWCTDTSGYPWSILIRFNIFSYELSLIGTFLRWAPKDNCIGPG